MEIYPHPLRLSPWMCSRLESLLKSKTHLLESITNKRTITEKLLKKLYVKSRAFYTVRL